MTLIKSISGIRGTIGGSTGNALTPIDTVKFVAAYATRLQKSNMLKKVVVGRDARVSGKMICDLVCATLQGCGIDVVDLGLSTTPTVEIAVKKLQAGGGIIITASHNPSHWNALKLLNENGEFLSEEAGREVIEIADREDFEFATIGKLGNLTQDHTLLDFHIDQIMNLKLVDKEIIQSKNFRVIVDAVHSSGGIAIPKLLHALGVEDFEIMHEEPTGIFPHNPEPLPENLTAIISKMEKGNYNLGIVVDPDVDRLAFISEDGTPFGEEYTLVAVADYILSKKTGNTVSNLSSTQALREITEKKGGQYCASAVGEVNVVAKMKATNAIIGGEGNGGIIYPEMHYGRDALTGIALFLTHLAQCGKSAKMLRNTYPNYHISKNKIELTPEIDVNAILKKIKKKYKKQPINVEDGLKITFDSEWIHLRKSNTEPIIRIYSESHSVSTAENLVAKVIADIKEIIANQTKE